MAAEIRSQGNDPVLRQEQYEAMVTSELQSKHNLKFRDGSELSQATKFLHENGVLLHYEDATLRDLYFFIVISQESKPSDVLFLRSILSF